MIIENVPIQKIVVARGFIAEFNSTFKVEILPILHKFYKIEEKGIQAHTFYETSNTLMPKPGEDIIRKENSSQYLL